MINKALTATIAAALLTAPAATAIDGKRGLAAAPPRSASSTGGFVPAQLIVKFRSGVAAAARDNALSAAGGSVDRTKPAGGFVLVDLPEAESVRQAAAEVQRDPSVLWVQPNYYQQGGALPNDPLFGEQWALHNTGQAVNGATGTAGVDIGAAQAWDRTTGSPDVRVAVVDSGIDLSQPDLVPNIWRNPGESGNGRENNGIDDDGDGFIDDWRGWDFVQQDNEPSDNYGHGSHVAGIIGARGNNGIGGAGVAWQSTIIPVRVLDNLNRGNCAEIAAGLAYAVRAGARVVNASIGSPYPCQPELDVINSAPDTLFVVSAMNDGANVDATPSYPCVYPSPNIVCVAATDSSDRLADFSNYGAQSVDLAAPGVDVLSTEPGFGPRETIYSDGFENPLPGRWVTGGSPDSWGRTPVFQRTGNWALSDSPFGNYANNTDTFIRLIDPLDLRGKHDCYVSVWVKHDLGSVLSQTTQDALLFEASPDGIHWGRRLDGLFGTSSGYERWLIDLSEIEGRLTAGEVRFRLLSNDAFTFAGDVIDDFDVRCLPPLPSSGAPAEFVTESGTSYAAPYVSGTAALLLSLDPGLSAVEVKRRLLSTADPVPSLDGKTVTGGRLDAAKAINFPPAGSPPPGGSSGQPGGSSGQPGGSSGQPGGSSGQPGGSSGQPGGSSGVAKALATYGRLLAAQLARTRIAVLLSHDGFSAGRVSPLLPGRLAVDLRGPHNLMIATTSHPPAGARSYTLRVKLTANGRKLLRRSPRLRATILIRLTPRSGAARVVRATVTLRR